MRRKIPAIIGGAVGAVSLVAAAGLAHERRQVGRERGRVSKSSAAPFGALPIDRQSTVLADDGVALHVEEVGPLDAPLTVVFVHGFTLSLGAFHFQRLALTKAFGTELRLVFYDLRSHGRSEKSSSEHATISQLGRDLATIIDDRVPSGPIVLVGHSMGGMTIMSMAQQRPDDFRAGRIGSLVFINTSSGKLRTVTLGLPAIVNKWSAPMVPVVLRQAAKNAQLIELGRALGKDVAWVITKRLSFAADDVDPAIVAYATNLIAATPIDVVSDFYSSLMDHDGLEGLANLRRCRVLVFGADRDALTPLSHAAAIAAALPGAELITVPHAGHLLMLEYPELVNAALVKFIRAELTPITAVTTTKP